MQWKHKDLLDISQLSAEEVRHVLATAAYFREINSRPVK
ncbi:MAG: aspartate carbamoyltransferase, partial [Humidesulfovibrio sp.]|nr:aspartate carbamoyltransferase [Humidesulfovibrio sp.]